MSGYFSYYCNICCRYYSGEKKAPVLTIFIGGNHEASNYLQELPYGGWVAPNIYYLGELLPLHVNANKLQILQPTIFFLLQDSLPVTCRVSLLVKWPCSIMHWHVLPSHCIIYVCRMCTVSMLLLSDVFYLLWSNYDREFPMKTRLRSYLLQWFVACIPNTTLSTFSLISLFKTATCFSKARYSLFVLKMPLNPNLSILWHPQLKILCLYDISGASTAMYPTLI